MAIKRIVDIGFWNDDKVLELFSPEDKLFMLYLLTNPHTTQLGIYKINKKIMAFELGYSIDTINVLLERFENKYNIIRYSTNTNEIAIRNYLKYSIIKGGKPVEDCLKKELNQVKDTNLIKYVFDNIKNFENLNETVKCIINNYNIYNDNDVSSHDTLDDTSVKSKEDLENEFEILWKAYPRKQGKAKALKSFLKARKRGVTIETITLGLQKYCDYVKRRNIETQYIPYGSTWFNGECWNDEYENNYSNKNAAPVPDWFNKDYSEKDDRKLSDEDYEFIRQIKERDRQHKATKDNNV